MVLHWALLSGGFESRSIHEVDVIDLLVVCNLLSGQSLKLPLAYAIPNRFHRVVPLVTAETKGCKSSTLTTTDPWVSGSS